MARFAQVYSDQFSRIEAISKVDDELRMLDLKLPELRNAVDDATNASGLYRGNLAERY